MNKQVEQLRAEIERLKKENNCSPLSVYNDLLSFIDSLHEEPVSEDLEKVAGNYAMNELNVFGNQDGWTENGTVYDMIKATARHFANWQREQIMMDAIEGQITLNEMGNPCVMLPPRFNAGDEVKLIVLKENKV